MEVLISGSAISDTFNDQFLGSVLNVFLEISIIGSTSKSWRLGTNFERIPVYVSWSHSIIHSIGAKAWMERIQRLGNQGSAVLICCLVGSPPGFPNLYSGKLHAKENFQSDYKIVGVWAPTQLRVINKQMVRG